jgi:hypothetical protein
MVTKNDVLRLAEQKLIGKDRDFEWFENEVGEALPRDHMPSDATTARLAYYFNDFASTLRPDKFDPNDDAINGWNFAEAAHESRLTLSEGDQVWAKVKYEQHRGTIPKERWLKEMNLLARQKPLL